MDDYVVWHHNSHEKLNYFCQVPVQRASSIIIWNIWISIPFSDNMIQKSRLTILCSNMCGLHQIKGNKKYNKGQQCTAFFTAKTKM